VYAAGYTLGRFFIELMRTDPATRVFGDIRINVVVAAVVFVGAVAYLVVVRKPREVPPFDGPAPAADPAAATADPAGETDVIPDEQLAGARREPVPVDAPGGPDPAPEPGPDRTP
jgi:hypothetical protein